MQNFVELLRQVNAGRQALNVEPGPTESKGLNAKPPSLKPRSHHRI